MVTFCSMDSLEMVTFYVQYEQSAVGNILSLYLYTKMLGNTHSTTYIQKIWGSTHSTTFLKKMFK